MKYEDLGTGDRMASMRTGLAFQRTRLAADRTLMAIMRTALSMIGFGFTIYTFFTNFIRREDSLGLIPGQAPGRFGLALIVLGVLLLALGIANHYRYMQSLRAERASYIADGLLPDRDDFPVSLTLVTAFLLILVGLVAAFSIVARAWPFV